MYLVSDDAGGLISSTMAVDSLCHGDGRCADQGEEHSCER